MKRVMAKRFDYPVPALYWEQQDEAHYSWQWESA